MPLFPQLAMGGGEAICKIEGMREEVHRFDTNRYAAILAQFVGISLQSSHALCEGRDTNVAASAWRRARSSERMRKRCSSLIRGHPSCVQGISLERRSSTCTQQKAPARCETGACRCQKRTGAERPLTADDGPGNIADFTAVDTEIPQFAGRHAIQFSYCFPVLAPVGERACDVHDVPFPEVFEAGSQSVAPRVLR